VHEVLLERAAERDLKGLSLTVYDRIVPHLKALSQNPRPTGCKKIAGSRSDWRIRIGDYRVIYEIDDRAKRSCEFGIDAKFIVNKSCLLTF
jgi:mRNA interferase RelE/StbE